MSKTDISYCGSHETFGHGESYICGETSPGGIHQCKNCKIKDSNTKLHAMQAEHAAFAMAIHYPGCWDTAAYPTLASALSEVYAWGNCSVCSTPVATTAAQRVAIAEAFANHDWVDDYLNSIAGVIKAAEAVTGAIPAPTENPSTRETGWKQAVMLAYGHLWHTNNEPMAPIPLRSPENAAYEARKLLREMLTHTERGEAINQVAALLATEKEKP